MLSSSAAMSGTWKMQPSSISEFFNTQSTESDSDMHSLSQTQNVAIGVYLFIIGILATIGNASLIGTFVRFRKLLSCPYRLLTLHLCITNFIMTFFAGFIISGSSSLAGRWLFGDKGCQYYVFAGFLLATAMVTFICVMSVIRCLIGMRKPPIMPTKSAIKKFIYFVWIWSLFWSVCPLLGWASYGYEPSKMTCTINWQQNDVNYVSYILFFTTFVFFIPLMLMVVCTFVAFKEVRKMKPTEPSSGIESIEQLKGIKMCVWLMVTCGLWTPCALLCLWVVFLSPETVPVFLSVYSPLFAKLSAVIQPLIIIAFDDSLRRGALACFLCQKPPPEMIPSPETTRMTSVASED